MRGSTSTRSLFLTLWTLPRAGDPAKGRPVLARRIFGAAARANSDLAHRPIAGCGSGLAGPLAFVHLLDPPRIQKSFEEERPLNGLDRLLRKLLASHRIMRRIGFRHPIGMFIR